MNKQQVEVFMKFDAHIYSKICAQLDKSFEIFLDDLLWIELGINCWINENIKSAFNQELQKYETPKSKTLHMV